jgi:hypothetical protein
MHLRQFADISGSHITVLQPGDAIQAIRSQGMIVEPGYDDSFFVAAACQRLLSDWKRHDQLGMVCEGNQDGVTLAWAERQTRYHHNTDAHWRRCCTADSNNSIDRRPLMEERSGTLNIDDHAYEWVCTTIIANINTNVTVLGYRSTSESSHRKSTEDKKEY